MIENKLVLAIIPARGGSKGVRRKNLREIGGKPLIGWTIEAAQKSRYIDKLILSSEDDEIIYHARKLGCDVPFVRPMELARDDSSVIDVAIHAIDMVPGYDIVVLLQPTSPLREANDIDECIAKCINSKATVCISVAEPDKSPYWTFGLTESDFIKPIFNIANMNKRRQDLPASYIPNGAVYVAIQNWLLENKTYYSEKTTCYIMPKQRSLDIDTEIDFQLLEAFLKKKKMSQPL